MTRFLTFLLFVSLSFLSTHLNAQEPTYFGGEEGKKLDWTLFYLRAHYVDSTDNKKLTELAIQRMLQELDPFSNYQSKEQLDEQRKQDDGAVNDGLGIRYYFIRDTATVTYIDESGPASEAGLRKGDRLLTVDKTNIIGQNFGVIEKQVRAIKGTDVAFSIFRKSENRTFDLNITSETILVPSVDVVYVVEKNIGYIRANRFTTKTIWEFRAALDSLKKEGIENLVLDLRNNRGGVVNGAVAMVDEFLSPSKIIMHSNGQGMPREEYFSTEVGRFKKGKLVVLVNGLTASASEIFTGAIQEWDRALVIGEMTYGKGLIQQSYLLGDSSAVRLTIGRYYTPTDRTLQRPFRFDTSKDWIFQNIANSITTKDGFTAGLEVPDSVAWKTKSGRKILKGQGSIIPDIFMPQVEVKKPILQKLNELGLVYRFTVFHSDEFRDFYEKKFKNGTEFRLNKKVDQKIAADFSKYLTENLENKEFAHSITNKGIPKTIIQQIKAWMGPQIWESESYFSIYNEEDPLILRAMETMKDGTFKRVGIEY